MTRKTAKRPTRKPAKKVKRQKRSKRPTRARTSTRAATRAGARNPRRGQAKMTGGMAPPDSTIVRLKPKQILNDDKWNARNYEHLRGTGRHTDHVTEEPGTQMSDVELEADIKKNGLLQNLIVRANPDKKSKQKYMIVAGSRRHKALSKLSPDMHVACYVLASTGKPKEDEFNASAINLSENLQRRDLKPFEIADKLCMMRKARPATSVKELAKRTGLSYPYVSALLRIRTKAVPQLWDLFCEYGTVFGNGITYKDMIKIVALPKGEQLRAWNKLVAERTGKSSKRKKTKKGPQPLKPGQLDACLADVDSLAGPPAWRKGVAYGLLVAMGRQTWSKSKAPKRRTAKAASKRSKRSKPVRKHGRRNIKSNSQGVRARA